MEAMVRFVSIPEMRIYARRLVRARKKAGRTQREVAEAISCTQGFISRVEDGQMMLRAADYPIVAEYLGVPIEELLGPFTEEEKAELAKAPSAPVDGFDVDEVE